MGKRDTTWTISSSTYLVFLLISCYIYHGNLDCFFNSVALKGRRRALKDREPVKERSPEGQESHEKAVLSLSGPVRVPPTQGTTLKKM